MKFNTEGFDITDIRYDKNGYQCVYFKKWGNLRSGRVQMLGIKSLSIYMRRTKMELLTDRKFLEKVSEVITEHYL